MGDIADNADSTIAQELARRIDAAKKISGPASTGVCLYCDTPLLPKIRWCDAACRDGWEIENKYLNLK